MVPPFSDAYAMHHVLLPKAHLPNDDRPEEVEPGAASVERSPGIPPGGVKAPLSPEGLLLPHERDQSGDSTAVEPDPVMIQAKRDIDAGLVDTDMRATPGLDAKLRMRLVPGPGGKPPPSGD